MSDHFSKIFFKFEAEDPQYWLERIESAVSRHEKMILKIKH